MCGSVPGFEPVDLEIVTISVGNSLHGERTTRGHRRNLASDVSKRSVTRTTWTAITHKPLRGQPGGGDVADDIQRKLEDKTSKVEILLDEGADPPTGTTSATCTWARTWEPSRSQGHG